MKAFPCRNIELEDNRAGMDMRDYFAAKALQSILANDLIRNEIKCSSLGGKNSEKYAKAAYIYADAMMEART